MQDALFRTVLGTMRTVSHCFRYGIITLQEPQGIGEHPTPCGFCIARLRQGDTRHYPKPECTSWAILILLSVALLGPAPRRGCWIYAGCIISPSAWQHCQAGSLPSCPVSCCCGQLRTDREYPAVHPGGFFHTPGPAKTPGSFYTLPLLTNTPPLKRAPWCTGEVAGSIQPAPMCAGFSFPIRRRCAAWAIRAMQTVSCGASIAHG